MRKITIKKRLTIALVILIALYLTSVFKNIQYPLLWNDEGATVFYATRILDYGYPKVHGPKNILNLMFGGNPSVLVKEEHDTYLAAIWGQYYFAAPFVRISQNFSDLYTRTAVMRIPFALMGILGLSVAASIGLAMLKNTLHRRWFAVGFILLQLLSVSMTLHLREVRSYSLTITLVALITLLCVLFRITKSISPRIFIPLYMLAGIVLMGTHYMEFIILMSFSILICLYRLLFAHDRTPQTITLFITTSATSLLFLPFAWYFELFNTVQNVSSVAAFSYQTYLTGITNALRYFFLHEYLLVAILFRIGIFLFASRQKVFLQNRFSNIQTYGLLTSLFFIWYITVMARVPGTYDRYFVPLQPLLIVMMLLDAIVLYEAAKKKVAWLKKYIPLIAVALFISTLTKLPTISGHLYEITHQYKGPLDYAIGYITDHFDKPDQLTIATNYEEAVFMYYLGSRVIVGQSGINLEENLKRTPDIVLLRKFRPEYVQELTSYLDRGTYNTVTFPVVDSFVNTIPEFTHKTVRHRFKTQYTSDPNSMLEIHVLDANVNILKSNVKT